MKTGITGLIIGILIGLGLGASRFKVEYPMVDLTDFWTPELRDLAGQTWFTNAFVYSFGEIGLAVPVDDSNGNLFITFGANNAARVLVMDTDANGTPDSVVIFDQAMRSVSADFDFDTKLISSIGFSTGIDASSISYIDRNIDGQYEIAIGPGKDMRVWVDGHWHTFVMTNESRMIWKNDQLVPVFHSNHVWYTEVQ